MLMSFINNELGLETDIDSIEINYTGYSSDNYSCRTIYNTEESLRYSLDQVYNNQFQPIFYEYQCPNNEWSYNQNLETLNDPLSIDTKELQINETSILPSNQNHQIFDDKNKKIAKEVKPNKNDVNNNKYQKRSELFDRKMKKCSVNGYKINRGKREYKEVDISNGATPLEYSMVRKGYKKCLIENNDAYSPNWVIYHNGDKEGLCQFCFQQGKELTFKLKSSAYWYHMNYFHGVSSKTRDYYPDPVDYRSYHRPFTKSQKMMKNFTPRKLKQGLCSNCKKWIDLDSKKICPVKSPNIYWWKHCQVCLNHKS